MASPIITVNIQYEFDVVFARQRAREIAGLLAFDRQDQVRIATAVSEIARNAFMYGRGGKVEFQLEGETQPQIFLVRVNDQGPGIRNLQEILDGRYRSKTGMGLGIIGARRLVDQCEFVSVPERGTTVWIKKILPKAAPLVTPAGLVKIADRLAAQQPKSPFEEVQRQNQELLHALSELRERQDELVYLNRELEDTNRGVVALYSELDEKANHLRRAGEMKTSFLSNMSHEFRTPLNSILALSKLLLDRADGSLTEEQDKQVRFIRKGADNLLELVNDLLDLAKIEAGKIDVYPIEFSIGNLFSALRGMLRPLLVGGTVNLVFEEPEGIPLLYNDEGKISQVLRNFISNALKFTERGEVRVAARVDRLGKHVVISVADTGIGIAPEDQSRIFEEFTQLDNPMQWRVKGTGLGLPLCRKLASLLGGKVSLHSEVNMGSVFNLTVPLEYVPAEEALPHSAPRAGDIDSARIRVRSTRVTQHSPLSTAAALVIDDEESARYVLAKLLSENSCEVQQADNGEDGLRMAIEKRPQIIFLDLNMPGLSGWTVLTNLKANPVTAAIPIVVVTSQMLSGLEEEKIESAAYALIKKNELTRETVEAVMKGMIRSAEQKVMGAEYNNDGKERH